MTFTPLRGREFRLLFVGQLVSFFGSMITFVALPFQMYELTGSTLAVGALVMFVCSTALAGLYALLRPPLDALAPRVVPREQLNAAMALEWVRGDVGMVAGPAAGGTGVVLALIPSFWRYDARRPAPAP